MVVAASTVSTGRSSISTVPKNHSLSSRQNDASPNPSRRPLIASERDNASVTRRLPAKEISSRYLSSYTCPSSITSTSHSSNTTTLSSSYSASSRRFPSPAPNHRPSTPPSFPPRTANRRSYSVDRTRPTTPRVDSRGGVGDCAVLEMSNAGRAVCTTTRSLSVSFQGESFFYQTSKAKTPSPVPTRKHPTPERRRATTPTRSSAPCSGEKSSEHHHHHCWPAARSRQSNLLTKSLDCSSDKDPIFSTAQLLRQSMLFVDGSRRPSSDGADFSISSDTDSLSSGSNPGTPELRFPTRAPASPRLFSMPARIRQETNGRLRSLPHHGTPLSSSSSKSSAPLKMSSVRRSPADSPVLPPPRTASSPLRGPMRPSCPSKVAGSPCRTASPSRGRGNSMLPVSSSRDQPANASSITSFVAELRRSKKGESQIEDAHMLRVLYNKHLHWRHANARANAALLIQRVSTEKKMHNAWITSSKLYDLVTVEKIKLQLLTQQLKQAIILKGQMIYLEDWFTLEKDHSCSLSRAIEALKACTLHLPVVNGARAELKDVKDAVGSAIDVMQAMGASICSLLSKVESTSSFASQLSEVVARERELMHQSRDLLSTVAALHVTHCSLRGQFLQLKRRPGFVQP